MKNPSKYEIFTRAVELRSFTKAAQELGYTQSAVSQTIAQMEQELGVPLFLRKPRGVQLTQEGIEIGRSAARKLEGVPFDMGTGNRRDPAMKKALGIRRQ